MCECAQLQRRRTSRYGARCLTCLGWKLGFIVCWVYDATGTTPRTAHRPPLQWPSATARRHSSRRRRCLTQRRLTTATWYAGQLLPEVVLHVALITLLSSRSARLPLSMSATAFSATCWRQHYWLELCGISIFGGAIIAIRICHDTTSLSRFSIRYDISCHHYRDSNPGPLAPQSSDLTTRYPNLHKYMNTNI